MSYSRRSRYSRSPSPNGRYSSRSLSRSRSRSRGRSRSADVENPGNNLYVTGLSARISKRDLEKHFSAEGKVTDVHLVVDPRTRESRGFGFVTMDTVENADRCIKYLDRSVLESRVITVEKARRRRGRTPTPGKYLGLRTIRVRRRTPSYSPSRQSPCYSPYRRSRSRSPRYSSERSRSRSYSPYYGRRRSYSPYYSRRRSYSPYYRKWRSYTRLRSPYSRSPDDLYKRRDRSHSPYDDPFDDRHYRRRDRSYSPDDSRYDDDHYNRKERSVSWSPTPLQRRKSRRISSRRSCSRSISPIPRSSMRSYSRSVSPRPKKSSRRGNSRESYTRSSSRSQSASSRSVSPRSASSPSS